MSGLTIIDLPNYAANPDYAAQEYYQELLNAILTRWFSRDGFYQPILTNAQAAAVFALSPRPPLGTHWYNSDLDKMQFVGAAAIQTITSV